MKKLIVYSSKTGTTEKCAGILGQNFDNGSFFMYKILSFQYNI